MSLSPKRTSQDKRARLVVISAPSGAGKTTLCQMLLKEVPSLKLSISATTRTKRPEEEDGKHYFFLKRDVFEQKRANGEFAEWAAVHDNLYGTPKAEVEKHLAKGEHVLFAIDVQGAMSLLKLYGDRVLLIFIKPPSVEVLEKRLLSRKQDSAESIETRLQNAYNELEWSKSFDYQILNDDLNRAFLELKGIIQKECL